VVKSHGGADDVGFATAVCLAIDLVNDRLTERIAADFARFTATAAGADSPLTQAMAQS
jgi:glycerol-3-phosphate acyltransferase PlsX